MAAIGLADAKAHLSELVDRVAAGEAIEITRRGKTVARLTGIVSPRKPIDAARLRAFTASLPRRPMPAGALLRSMRDSDRY